MQQIIAVFSGFLSSKSVFSYPFQNIFFLLFKLRYFWSLGFQIIVIYRENKTPSFLNTLNLKVLRNRISRIIRLWSLFCSILVYASLHFLSENIFLSFLPVMCRIWCNLHKLYNICTIFVYTVFVYNLCCCSHLRETVS